MNCAECEHNNTNCYIRYWKDLCEFGEIEWLCPRCDKSHIKKDADLKCDNCGFTYECK